MLKGGTWKFDVYSLRYLLLRLLLLFICRSTLGTKTYTYTLHSTHFSFNRGVASSKEQQTTKCIHVMQSHAYIIGLEDILASRTQRIQCLCPNRDCGLSILWLWMHHVVLVHTCLSDTEISARHDSFHHGWVCSPEREGEAYHLSPHFMPCSKQSSAKEDTQYVAIIDTPSLLHRRHIGGAVGTFNHHIQKGFWVLYPYKNVTFPLQYFQNKVSWLQPQNVL